MAEELKSGLPGSAAPSDGGETSTLPTSIPSERTSALKEENTAKTGTAQDHSITSTTLAEEPQTETTAINEKQHPASTSQGREVERASGAMEEELAPAPDSGTEATQVVDDETAIIERVDANDSTPQSPTMCELLTTSIKKVHALGDLHGWAPGLITYLIQHRLAEIEIDGYPMQTKDGDLHVENLNATFQSPIVKWHNLPKSGLKDQPGGEWFGVQNGGHGAVRARWIADPGVAFVQVGDIFDRADHSELAAEILRQLLLDAPGRVFVLVGNHEQFMLENDFSNWAHNEVRSAYTDHVQPKKGVRAHFRFYNPAIDQDEMMEEVFSRYKASVWTLFLTQGAVLEKLGWLDKSLTKKWDLQGMLNPGWTPYEHAVQLRHQAKKGESIPGAISALTMNDILFHHAEPAAHQADRDGNLLELHKTISTQRHPGLNEFKMQMYRYGGESLHGSEDQRLLWARGSSSGANSGNPSAQQHIEDLAVSWPGLHRIVHGHTPTVGLSEFNAVTSGESRPVSYDADAVHHQAAKGRANRVRVHNIDEGMSPVYHAHANDDPYDPTRVPIGLRMELNAESQVEANRADHEHVHLVEGASMQVDRRELWKWQQGQWKSNLPAVFEDLADCLYLGETQDEWRCMLLIGNSDDQSNTSKQLSRNVGGRKVGSMLINRCLNKLVNAPKLETPPAFAHVKPIGSGLLEGKTLSLLSSNNISFIATKVEKKSLVVHIVNGFEDPFVWELSYAPELESKSKTVGLTVPADTHSTVTVHNAGVVSLGPPNRTKSAIKFFTTQEGDASATKGVVAHYLSATRASQTAGHAIENEVYIHRALPPTPPPTIQQARRSERRNASGGAQSHAQAANQKRQGGGLHGQVTGAQQPPKASIHQQHSEAGKGKEAQPEPSRRDSRVPSGSSSVPSIQSGSTSSSLRGQRSTNTHASAARSPPSSPNTRVAGNQNKSSATPRNRPTSKLTDFLLDDFNSMFQSEVLDKLSQGTDTIFLRFEYEVKSGWKTLYFKFTISSPLSMVRIDCAAVRDGMPREIRKFIKQSDKMQQSGGVVASDSAEGEFLAKVGPMINKLNEEVTKLFRNRPEE